jgi:hypothetical protein
MGIKSEEHHELAASILIDLFAGMAGAFGAYRYRQIGFFGDSRKRGVAAKSELRRCQNGESRSSSFYKRSSLKTLEDVICAFFSDL